MKSENIVCLLVIILICVSHLMGLSVFWTSVFYLTIISFSLFTVIHFFKSSVELKVNIPEIILIAYILYLLISNTLNGTFIGNNSLHVYLLIFSLYWVFKIITTNNKNVLSYMFYGLLLGGMLEITVGFGQIFGFLPNVNSTFRVGGLFGNPAILAGVLSYTIPFIFVVVLDYKKLFSSENFYYTIICCLLFSFYLIVVMNSRGAWISSFIAVSLVLNNRYEILEKVNSVIKTRLLKISSVVLSFLIITMLAIGLYNYKQDSAFGRLFIWKTSRSMLTENIVLGNGYSSFSNDYGKVQAEYFLTEKAKEKEIYVSDYVTCAYNEFLEHLIDTGIIGLLLLLLILGYALCDRPSSNESYHYAAKFSLVALLVLCMVSYPFSTPLNILMLVCFLLVIFTTGSYRRFSVRKYQKLILSFWAITICLLMYFNARHAYGMYYLHRGHECVVTNHVNEGVKVYKKAYQYLEYNGDFQFHYGSALNLNKDYEKSILHLEKATQLNSNPNAFIMLGNSLRAVKRFDEAEMFYKTASAIIPNRLYPRYLLVNLYNEMGERQKAIELAEEILYTEEKVITTAGKEIKAEMAELLERLTDK